MPLRLNIRRKLTSRSDRVKCVDMHPDEPWLLCSLYNGNVHLWNYQTQALLKTFEVTELPVRASKFVSRKQWIVTGADDLMVRVFNYNTMEKIKTWEAHTDYLRNVAVHPSLPYILTCSDDMTIKLWDWDMNFDCKLVYEGHSHYVMQVVFNPKDPNTFASASLDRTIKVWGLTSANPHFTLEGHEKGVNCIDYFPGGDKPFLISGADDKAVKVWDYQARTCVQTLTDHTHNVSCVAYHPDLPIIITGAEDGAVRLFHSNTYSLENTLNYGMERVWSVAVRKGSNRVGLGYDEGSTMIKMGKEQPVASMDHTGKIIWAKHNEIQMVNVGRAGGAEVADGERLPLAVKELGNCEVYPQVLRHDPKGRVAVVCGDGEYIIYTALAWRNKSFGSALEVVWAHNGDYATRDSSSKIRMYRDFKEHHVLNLGYNIDGIYGGAMLAVRNGQDFVFFYDWETGSPVRRIDVATKNVFWNESAMLCCVASDTAFYVLQYDRDAVASYLEKGVDEEEGCEEAFEPVYEVSERVSTGRWLGDCFVYTNSNDRLNYCVGGEVQTLHHLDKRMYLLGYIAKDNRLYLIDKEFNVVSYELLLSILEYKTCVVRKEFDAAAKLLPSIPAEHHNKIARFLEAQGFQEQALDIATDPDYRFELAVHLGRLEDAVKIVAESETDHKWRQLGDLAISGAKFPLAIECLTKARDYPALLLLHTSMGNREGVEKLAKDAAADGRTNVAFLSSFLLCDVDACLTLLCESGRAPEAAMLARTYAPSQVSRMVEAWREDLKVLNPKAAESLADPQEYPNLFEHFDLSLVAELLQSDKYKAVAPASAYPDRVGSLAADLIEEARGSGVEPPAQPSGGGGTAAEAAQAKEAEEKAAAEAAAAKQKAAEEAKAKAEADLKRQAEAAAAKQAEAAAAKKAAEDQAAKDKAEKDKAAADAKAAADKAAADKAAAEAAAAEKAEAEAEAARQRAAAEAAAKAEKEKKEKEEAAAAAAAAEKERQEKEEADKAAADKAAAEAAAAAAAPGGEEKSLDDLEKELELDDDDWGNDDF
mmetsp:Transcript_28597/g.72007  ORF Transcript_28597/g.72007 Transcript_28597/m.72007 type:complete len:1045 (+) Transcript_28597:152-3286(+)